MTAQLKRIFVLLLCMVALPTLGLAVEILYPSDMSSVLRSDYLIIRCGTDPLVEAVTVELGGVKSDLSVVSDPDYRAAWGDMLILAPDFDPGVNHLVVEAIKEGGVAARAEIDFFYIDGAKFLSAPSRFRPFVMHQSEDEKLCRQCHNMTPSEAELQIQDVGNNPCTSCHERMLDSEFVHGPAGVFQCGYCHSLNSQPRKYVLRDDEKNICVECHTDMERQFDSKPFLHGPVAVGLCSFCHDAHGSQLPSQLKAPVNDLCFSCHDEIRDAIHVVRGMSGKGHPLSGVRDISNPGRELSCVSCHDPHAGQSSQYFRGEIASRFTLCNRCHRK